MVPSGFWFLVGGEDSREELRGGAAAAVDGKPKEEKSDGGSENNGNRTPELAGSGVRAFPRVLREHRGAVAVHTEQQLALGAQLKASVEKRDKIGNCLVWLEGQADLLREKEKQLADRRHRFEKFVGALRSSLHRLGWTVR
jgi:hypothetical protein